jgi:hypothetical protein
MHGIKTLFNLNTLKNIIVYILILNSEYYLLAQEWKSIKCKNNVKSSGFHFLRWTDSDGKIWSIKEGKIKYTEIEYLQIASSNNKLVTLKDSWSINEITLGSGDPPQVWENEYWRIFVIPLWSGGCGIAAEQALYIVISENKQTKHWQAKEQWGFSISGPLSADSEKIVLWFREQSPMPLKCFSEKQWIFNKDDEHVKFCHGKQRYQWWTLIGFCTSFGETPEEARHIGRQEMAWHLKNWDEKGGLAVAFADTPRDIPKKAGTSFGQMGSDGKMKWDLLIEHDPLDGTLPPKKDVNVLFRWPIKIFVIPFGKRGDWLNKLDALSNIKTGKWDVMLSCGKSGKPWGLHLVEHYKDMLHSTPPCQQNNQ